MGGDFNSSKGMRVVVGLQTLFLYSQVKCNVVQQASLKSHTTNNLDSSSSCYLKSCCLCNKKLRLDKDVYMYRGDQGFCSIECRDRQMHIDEMKEWSMRRRQRKSQLSETRLLLEEMCHRRTALHQKRYPIFRTTYKLNSKG